MPLNLDLLAPSEMDISISIPQCENCKTDVCVCPSTQATIQDMNEYYFSDTIGMNRCACVEGACNCDVHREVAQCTHLTTCDKCGDELIGVHFLPKNFNHQLCPASELCPVCDEDKYLSVCCPFCDPDTEDPYNLPDNSPKEFECEYCGGLLSSPDEPCWCYDSAKYGGGCGRSR